MRLSSLIRAPARQASSFGIRIRVHRRPDRCSSSTSGLLLSKTFHHIDTCFLDGTRASHSSSTWRWISSFATPFPRKNWMTVRTYDTWKMFPDCGDTTSLMRPVVGVLWHGKSAPACYFVKSAVGWCCFTRQKFMPYTGNLLCTYKCNQVHLGLICFRRICGCFSAQNYFIWIKEVSKFALKTAVVYVLHIVLVLKHSSAFLMPLWNIYRASLFSCYFPFIKK
jgi:hypothetical protein